MTNVDPYLAAAVQFEPAMGQKTRNLTRLIELTESAVHKGARLVVLPEMATTGYCWSDREEVAPLVETIPGPTTEIFSRLARRHACWIVVGLPEIDASTDIYFNSAALIGPDGVQGVYRKTHSFITEVRWAQDGNLGLPVFETEVGVLGLLICMDAEYPEPARVLALQDCDIVCFPTNWLADRSPSSFWMTRAFENGTYWVASNRHGLERGVQFSGGTAVIGPDGSVIDRVNADDGVALGLIDLELARSSRRSRLKSRPVELSATLLQNTHLWPDVFRGPVDDTGALHGVSAGGVDSTPRLAVLSDPNWDRSASDVGAWTEGALPSGGFDLIAVPPRSLDESVAPDELERIEQSTRSVLGAIASATEAYVAGGLVLEEAGEFSERLYLIDSTGREVLGHSALIKAGHEPEDASIAPAPPIVDTDWGRFGLLTGAELLHPEPLRYLAVRGVDIVACAGKLNAPSSRGYEPREEDTASVNGWHWLLPRVRAAENNVWLLFANAGSVPSGVFGPLFYKVPRAEAMLDGELAATLQKESDSVWNYAVRQKPYLRMRIPHLYERLMDRSDKAE